MSIADLPEDIITMIIDRLDNPVSFIKTNKRLYNIGQRYGYVKHIVHRWDDNLWKLATVDIFRHSHTLKSLSLEYVEDPHIWFCSHYPETIILIDCKITRVLKFTGNDVKNIKRLYIHINRNRLGLQKDYEYQIDISNLSYLQDYKINYS